MAKTRDPYYQWLGIPPKDQPANHYRLLGLEIFEENRDVIAAAADRQMSFVKSYQCGEDSELSQKVLNELSAARLCLLNPQKKADYDKELRFSTKCEFVSDDVETEVAAGQAAWLDHQKPKPPALPVARTPAPNPFASRVVVISVAAGLACVLAGVAVGLVALSMHRNGDPEGDDVAQNPQESPTSEVRSEQGLLETYQQIQEGMSLAAEETTPVDNVDPPPATDTAVETNVAESEPQEPQVLANIPPATNPIESTPSPAPPSKNEPVPSIPQPEQESGTDEPVSSPATEETETDGVDAPGRLPIPVSELQDRLEKEIGEVFDLHPDSLSKKRELCEELLTLASDPQETPDRRFVLLRLVAELACETSDAELMLQAVDRIGAAYDIHAADAKATMLFQMLGDGENPHAVMAFLKAYQSVVIKAAADDDFDLAHRLSSAANALSDRPVGAREFRQGIKDRHVALQRLGSQHELVENAYRVLEKDEHNAEACLEVGRWLCLVKDDWDRGLDYLAQCSDERLRNVALQDLNRPPGDAAGRVALADAWWELAKDADTETKYGLLSRARHWYAQIDLDSLGGLNAVKTERVMAEIDELMGELGSTRICLAGKPSIGQTDDATSATSSQDLPSLFSRGMTAALQERDFHTAERIFGRCTDLEPENAAALNNCALASLRSGNRRRVIHLLQTAHELSPQSQQIAHNILLLSRLAGAKQISFDSSTQKSLDALCASAAGTPRGASLPGFLYMPLDGGSGTSGQYLDRACMYCNGLGHVECPFRGCSRGSVGTMRTDVVGRHPATGQPIVNQRPVRVPCPNCRGRGQVKCPYCTGGVMRGL
jgi:hypothetical protein